MISEKDRKRYTGLQEQEFLTGYIATGLGAKAFPTANSCDDLLKIEKPDNLTSFWGGLVSSVILRKFREDREFRELADYYFGAETRKILEQDSNEVSKWWNVLSGIR